MFIPDHWKCSTQNNGSFLSSKLICIRIDILFQPALAGEDGCHLFSNEDGPEFDALEMFMDKTSEEIFEKASKDESAVSFTAQLGPLLFLTSIFFLSFIGRIIFSPLMPAIENDLGLTHADAGVLFLMISLGYFVSLIGSGFISCRIGHKKTIVISSVAVGVMLWVISLCETLWGIRTGMFLIGLAAGLYLPSGIASVTSIADPRHWGRAIAIHELAPNLSFVLAPLLSEMLMAWFTWRGALLLLGICSILAGLAFGQFGKGAEGYGQAPSFSSFVTLFRERSFWIMILLFSFGITATLGIYAMLPLYLVVEQGIERNWANTAVALSRISGLFMAFLAGWVSDRVGPEKAMGAILLIAGIMTMLLGIRFQCMGDFDRVSSACHCGLFFSARIRGTFFHRTAQCQKCGRVAHMPVAFVLGGGAIPAGIGLMGDAGSLGLGIVLRGRLSARGFFSLCSLRFPAFRLHHPIYS